MHLCFWKCLCTLLSQLTSKSFAFLILTYPHIFINNKLWSDTLYLCILLSSRMYAFFDNLFKVIFWLSNGFNFLCSVSTSIMERKRTLLWRSLNQRMLGDAFHAGMNQLVRCLLSLCDFCMFAYLCALWCLQLLYVCGAG